MSGSLSGILSISRTALLAHQRSVATASHNIANANTPGYSRQRVDLASNIPQVWPQWVIGRGVHVESVERARDGLLDVAVRNNTTLAAGFGQRSTSLERIEGALAEPTDAGLAASLDAFWASWSDLSNNPGSAAARIQVAEKGQALASAFHRVDAGIDEARQLAQARLQTDLAAVNDLAGRIAQLNLQIIDTEAGAATANDLRDQRDLLTDELAQYVPVQVVERQAGDTGVYVEGLALVDGSRARALSLSVSGTTFQITTPGGGVLSATTGKLGAATQLLNGDLATFRADLDSLAAGLVSAVHTVHQTGTNPNGNTGVDFFDPAGVTARDIGLSAAVLADNQEIAAGTPDGAGAYQAGQNDVALALGALRDVPQAALGGRTFNDRYGEFVADIGLAVATAQTGVDAHDALRHQAEGRRAEISGVSVDEELVDLMRFQQAYTAAARLVNTADEMIQTVLNMV